MSLVTTTIQQPRTILLFFFNPTATPEIYTLSLHDALPICVWSPRIVWWKSVGSCDGHSRDDASALARESRDVRGECVSRLQVSRRIAGGRAESRDRP